MAPPTSKWAVDDDDEETAAAQERRRREKAERKRLKEEKARNAAAVSTAPIPATTDDYSERPSKRARTASFHDDEQENGVSQTGVVPQPATTTTTTTTTTQVAAVDSEEEGAHLLRFPRRAFGPCGHVEQFEQLNNIEEGSYGVVSRARRKTSGEIVALKRLKMDHTHNDGFPVTGLREIQTLMACRDDAANVVQLLEVVVGDSLKEVFLVMEFLEHDLKTLLDDMAEPFLPSETKTLMRQIASGVAYLHAHWILHRDLKTSNLLLNNRGEVKLADFGMARSYTSHPPPPKLTQLVVTLWYRAPELLLGADDYGAEVDVWSLGCVFAELLTKDPLFQGRNEVDQLSKIFTLLGTPTREAWPAFRSLPNAKALHPLLSSSGSPSPQLTAAKFPYLTSAGLRLLSSLLALNPASRPRAAEVLHHPYFREDPRPKPRELFPTFPSKAGQEKRRKKDTPPAPVRGDAPRLDEKDVQGMFKGWDVDGEEKGAGFALRLG